MLKHFEEVGGDRPEYFSSRTHFAKIEDKKVIAKNSSKNLTAGVFFLFFVFCFFFFFLLDCYQTSK